MRGFFYFSTMQLTKLNADSSWMFHFDGLHILVDPWFTASQVDFHPLFSRQFHQSPQPAVGELQQPDYIFISHPFTDHCNEETLLQFDKNIPVIALPSILKKIRKWDHFHQLMTLEEVPFKIQVLQTKNALVHKAYLIESLQNKIVYAPHGAQLKKDINLKIDAVITTSLQYRLPFFLGGTINLGLGTALQLQKQLKAKLLIDTHNEDKKGEGLVSWFAKRKFYTDSAVLNLKIGEFVDLN
jgi:L-ascorbate metabolism protein UlaG (beta-lactamase superfamily)